MLNNCNGCGSMCGTPILTWEQFWWYNLFWFTTIKRFDLPFPFGVWWSGSYDLLYITSQDGILMKFKLRRILPHNVVLKDIYMIWITGSKIYILDSSSIYCLVVATMPRCTTTERKKKKKKSFQEHVIPFFMKKNINWSG